MLRSLCSRHAAFAPESMFNTFEETCGTCEDCGRRRSGAAAAFVQKCFIKYDTTEIYDQFDTVQNIFVLQHMLCLMIYAGV